MRRSVAAIKGEEGVEIKKEGEGDTGTLHYTTLHYTTLHCTLPSDTTRHGTRHYASHLTAPLTLYDAQLHL